MHSAEHCLVVRDPGGAVDAGQVRPEKSAAPPPPKSAQCAASPAQPTGPHSSPLGLPSNIRRRAPSLPNSGSEPVEGGRAAPTSQKHQDAGVGEHGCGHPVRAGRTAPPGRLHCYGEEARAEFSCGAGLTAGVRRRSCKGPEPPSALTRAHPPRLFPVVSRAAHS